MGYDLLGDAYSLFDWQIKFKVGHLFSEQQTTYNTTLIHPECT